MSQPIYFLPNVQRQKVAPDGKPDLTALAQFGLSDIFRDADSVHVSDINSGPESLSGCLIIYQSPKTDLPQVTAFHADRQEWSSAGEGKFYLGWDKTSPPTPDDLVRPEHHGGSLVKLDRYEWMIPVIRRPDGSTSLPSNILLTERREVIHRDYQQLWEETEKAVEWVQAFQEGQTPDKFEAMELAVKGLALNYRIGPFEHDQFGDITSANSLLVLYAMCGFPNFEETGEKKQQGQPADMSSTPGNEDSCQVTDLAGQTC